MTLAIILTVLVIALPLFVIAVTIGLCQGDALGEAVKEAFLALGFLSAIAGAGAIIVGFITLSLYLIWTVVA